MEHEVPFGDSPRISSQKRAPESTLSEMPAETYRIRRAERQATFEALTRRHGQLANLRLGLALIFAVMAWLSFSRHLFAARWLAVPVVIFGIIALVHDRLLTGRVRARRAVRFYDRGIARLEDRWSGTGVTGQAYLPADHVYAADLDLFGPGSLFELISQARLAAGERTIADWLLQPAAPQEIRARQATVEELRPAGRSSRAPLARRRRSRRVARHLASRRVGTVAAAAHLRGRARRGGDARRVERRDAGGFVRGGLVARLVRPRRRRLARLRRHVARARLESPRLRQRAGSPAAAARRRAGRRRSRAGRHATAASGARAPDRDRRAGVDPHPSAAADRQRARVAQQPVLRAHRRVAALGHAMRVGDRGVASPERPGAWRAGLQPPANSRRWRRSRATRSSIRTTPFRKWRTPGASSSPRRSPTR